MVTGVLAGIQLQAQSVKRLTVKEAIDLGVANSKQLIVSNAKVKEAQAKVQQAQDKVIPEVGVSGTYLHLNTPTVSMANEASGNSGSSDSPLAALSDIHDVALVQVSASWPVFNGFKIRNTKMMNEFLEQAAQ